MLKILIIDGHDRRSLAAVRSLGQKKEGYYLIVGSSRRINSSRFSKYCNEFVRYPDPNEDEGKFVDFLIGFMRKNDIKVLLPMGDIVAEIASKNLDKLSSITNLLVPSYDVFMIARDKEQTLFHAEKNGVPIPKTYKIEDVISDEGDIQYPVIIKPRISSASIGLVVARNKNETIQLYDKINKTFERPLIQEVIPDVGEHYQANLLFDCNSELKASCIKRKIRQYPVSGGPSTFFKTTNNKIIEEMSIRFLKNINWIGPAEVEYMIDPRDGLPKLMEINPRLSATIRLSCFVGVDFPYLIVKNALKENTDVIINDKFDNYCQWFFPGDLLNFVFNKNRFKQEFGYIFKKPKKLCHMTFDKNDIKPFLANMLAYFIAIFNIKRLVRFIFRR